MEYPPPKTLTPLYSGFRLKRISRSDTAVAMASRSSYAHRLEIRLNLSGQRTRLPV